MTDAQVIIAIAIIIPISSLICSNSRVSDLGKKMDDFKFDLNQRMDDMKQTLRAEMQGIKTELSAEINGLKTEMKAGFERSENALKISCRSLQ